MTPDQPQGSHLLSVAEVNDLFEVFAKRLQGDTGNGHKATLAVIEQKIDTTNARMSDFCKRLDEAEMAIAAVDKQAAINKERLTWTQGIGGALQVISASLGILIGK